MHGCKPSPSADSLHVFISLTWQVVETRLLREVDSGKKINVPTPAQPWAIIQGGTGRRTTSGNHLDASDYSTLWRHFSRSNRSEGFATGHMDLVDKGAKLL